MADFTGLHVLACAAMAVLAAEEASKTSKTSAPAPAPKPRTPLPTSRPSRLSHQPLKKAVPAETSNSAARVNRRANIRKHGRSSSPTTPSPPPQLPTPPRSQSPASSSASSSGTVASAATATTAENTLGEGTKREHRDAAEMRRTGIQSEVPCRACVSRQRSIDRRPPGSPTEWADALVPCTYSRNKQFAANKGPCALCKAYKQACRPQPVEEEE